MTCSNPSCPSNSDNRTHVYYYFGADAGVLVGHFEGETLVLENNTVSNFGITATCMMGGLAGHINATQSIKVTNNTLEGTTSITQDDTAKFENNSAAEYYYEYKYKHDGTEYNWSNVKNTIGRYIGYCSREPEKTGNTADGLTSVNDEIGHVN